MKKITGKAGARILLLGMISSLTGYPLWAGGDVKFDLKEEDVAVVRFNAEQPASFGLSIVNDQENVVYYSEYPREVVSYGKRFDMSSLQDGWYKMIATLEGEEVTQIFRMQDGKISFIRDENAEDPFDPVFQLSGKDLYCQYNNTQGGDVTIRFYSADGDDFFLDEFVDQKSNIRKKFDVSRLAPGNYYVELKTSEYRHTFDFSL